MDSRRLCACHTHGLGRLQVVRIGFDWLPTGCGALMRSGRHASCLQVRRRSRSKRKRILAAGKSHHDKKEKKNNENNNKISRKDPSRQEGTAESAEGRYRTSCVRERPGQGRSLAKLGDDADFGAGILDLPLHSSSTPRVRKSSNNLVSEGSGSRQGKSLMQWIMIGLFEHVYCSGVQHVLSKMPLSFVEPPSPLDS